MWIHRFVRCKVLTVEPDFKNMESINIVFQSQFPPKRPHAILQSRPQKKFPLSEGLSILGLSADQLSIRNKKTLLWTSSGPLIFKIVINTNLSSKLPADFHSLTSHFTFAVVKGVFRKKFLFKMTFPKKRLCRRVAKSVFTWVQLW